MVTLGRNETSKKGVEKLPQINKAPWTEAEVDSLNACQQNSRYHPFTCENCRDNLGVTNTDGTSNDRLLVATKDGWICETCDYTQDWAHESMVNGSWREIQAGIENFARFVTDELFPEPWWKKALGLSLFFLPVVPVYLVRRLTVNRLLLLPAAVYSFLMWRTLKKEVRWQPGAKFTIGMDHTKMEGKTRPLDLILHWFGGLFALILFVRAIIRPRRSQVDDEAVLSF